VLSELVTLEVLHVAPRPSIADCFHISPLPLTIHRRVLGVDKAWPTMTALARRSSPRLATCLPPSSPLHYTRAPLAGYPSSPPGRPWLPAAPCVCFTCVSEVVFKCFYLYVAYVAMAICICCKYMFQMFHLF